MSDSPTLPAAAPGTAAAPDRRELLRQLLAERARGSAATSAVTAAAAADAAADAAAPQRQAVSDGQRALWFVHQLTPGSDAYHLSLAGRIRPVSGAPALDTAALATAVQQLVDRHAALRTTFGTADERADEDGGEGAGPSAAGVYQRVHPAMAADFAVVPAPGRTEEELHALVAAEAAAPFDLERGPLLRTRVFRHPDGGSVLLLTAHHIVTDLWSFGILLDDLDRLYRAARAGRTAELPPLRHQFADFVAWQRELLAGERGRAHEAYWTGHLAGGAPELDLPGDRPRPAVPSHRGGSHRFRLDAELTGRLAALARERGTTLYALSLALYQTLLHRYTGNEELWIGSVTAGRGRSAFEDLVGYFVNPVVVRAETAPDTPFPALLERARTESLAAMEHQDYPFPRLVAKLAPRRDASVPPLFTAAIAYESASWTARRGISMFASGVEDARLELGGLSLEPYPVGRESTEYDLTLFLEEVDGVLHGSLRYAADLFDPETAAQLAGHYRALARAVAEDPDRTLGELPMLGAEEHRRLLAEWNATALAHPDTPSVPALVDAQAARTPDAPAVADAAGSLTYRRLVDRSSELAAVLRGCGLGRGARIGLSFEGSTEMVVALLAILRIGAAYVPLDPDYPPERLRHMLGDAEVAAVLTQRRLVDRLPLDGVPALCVDEPWPAAAAAVTVTDTDTDTGPRDLACVIYTSGSTGLPKGVLVEHRGLVNLAHAQRAAFGLGPDDRVLQFASLSFDAATWECLMALGCGALLHTAPRAAMRPGGPLVALLRRERITAITLPPSALSLMDPADVPELRLLVSAGEACPADLPVRWVAAGRRFVNAYGPTETTVCATLQECDGTGTPSIGRPIGNATAYVLDAGGRPVPPGVVGQLYVGGAGVTRGYLNRPELTAEKFLPDPFAPHDPEARLYATGDRVRRRRDGRLDYLGRIDHQVKIRGFRIEPGEIETALLRHPAVREALALGRPDSRGELQLVAYAVAVDGAGADGAGTDGAGVDAAELRAHLRAALPAHMVPTHLMVLDAFPTTPNGKVDRRRLPAPQQAPRAAGPAPRTPLEEVVASIWAQVLDLPRVSVTEDFFELGGHSLLAARLVARLREAAGVELPLRAVFEAPTVEAQAALVERLGAGGAPGGPPSGPVPVGRSAGGLPLSYAQQRLWFLNQVAPGDDAYHMAGRLELAGPLDPAALGRALDALVERHEVLRTAISMETGEPRQSVRPATGGLLAAVDLRGADGARVEQLAAEHAARPFDLAAGPIRATLLRRADDRWTLLLAVHHIACDGWSMGVLLRELGALAVGGEVPELPLQYADFADWQQRTQVGPAGEARLAARAERLAGAPVLLELPADAPRTAGTERRGAKLRATISAELGTAVEKLGHSTGATPFMALLTAFAVLLSRWSGQDDLLIGTPSAGRSRRELEDLIGLFVTTQVLRADLRGGPSFRELLLRVREDVLDAFSHEDVPFERLVDRLCPQRDLARTPLFQVMFNMLSMPEPELRLPGVRGELVAAAEGGSKFDLTLYARPAADGSVALELAYDRDLFTAERMRALLDGFTSVLAAAVAAPDLPVAALPAGPRTGLPDPDRPLPQPPGSTVPLVGRFLAQAARTPDAVAVSSPDGDLRYAELASYVTRLAGRIGAAGLGRGDVLAVHGARTAALPGTLLAVHAAGAAFALLDPAHPAARLAACLRTAAPAAWIAVDGAPEPAPGLYDGLPRLSPGPAAATGPLPPPAPGDLGYLAFTSGSTGAPKAVRGAHLPLSRFTDWYAAAFGVGPGDRVGLTSGLGHDPLLRDCLVPLALGATVCVPPPGALADPGPFAGWLAEQRVTVLHLTPPTARFLAGAPDVELSALRRVFFSGDVLTGHEAALLRRLAPHAEQTAFYGATETPQAAAWHPVPADCPPGAPVPLGRGAAGHELLVLVGDRPAGVGELGEVCVRGHRLADGYAGDPRATAAVFRPGAHGTVLYRTGDLGRHRPDGAVEFAGRADRQLKIRGHRVEPAEVERALRACPGVVDAAVVAATDRTGERVLVGYPVGGGDAAALRAALGELLPAALVPSLLVPVPELPRTPNGKLDTARLPAPDQGPAPGGRAAAEGAEAAVAEVWAELLGLASVPADVNFFELGGHSLLAVRLQDRLRTRLGARLELVDIFRRPTVAGLAALLDQAAGRPRPPAPPAPARRGADSRKQLREQRRLRLKEVHDRD